jgi:hypothetical protein
MDAMQPAQLPAPAAPRPVTHDVTILRTRKYAQAKVMGVPPEEFGIERNARNIRDCNYAFHDIVTKSRAEWIAEGYDQEQVMKLPEYTGLNQAETIARDTVYEHAQAGSSTTNIAAQIVKVTEHYIRMDYEGNGKPKLYQVITGGDDGEILIRDKKDAVEEFDQMPFAGATPIPVPHRFFGKAIADLVIPIQKEKAAMKRGALDNLYLHNNPRVEVAEANAGPNTLDDLLVSRPGGIVRTKTAGGLNWQVVPDITGSIYPMLQYLDADLEAKTGLAKQTQGIDANALQNQSATAVAQVFSASQMRIKLIARVLAEGVRDMFSLLHATVKKHSSEAQTVRLRNQWVKVDPRNWKTRNDMTIAVGLGSGGKAQQFAQVMALANFQKELIMGGKAHMVPDDRLFNTAAEMTKIMGHKNPDRFFADPSELNPDGSPKNPPQPSPPDPKVMAIQAQAQNDQQELALKAQLDKQKAQDAAQLAQFKAETDAKLKVIEAHLKALEMERKAHTDQQAHHAKIAEAVVDVVAEAHKHDMAMAHEQQMHDQKLEHADAAHQAKLEQMRQKPKGKPDA